MPDAYEVHEGRFIQETSVTSAADALYIQSAVVPADTVWTVIGATVAPSVAETRVYTFEVWGRSGQRYPCFYPLSYSLDPNGICLGFPTDGNEIKLFPGERLGARRSAATAGSTMFLFVRFIASNLEYYREIDQHKELRRKTGGPLQFFRSRAVSSGRPGGRTRTPPAIEGRGGAITR